MAVVHDLHSVIAGSRNAKYIRHSDELMAHEIAFSGYILLHIKGDVVFSDVFCRGHSGKKGHKYQRYADEFRIYPSFELCN